LAVNVLWLLPLAWAAAAKPQFTVLWLSAAWLPLVAIAAYNRAGVPE
jgi:Fuc2NAc and GlcNAc transferase